MKEIKKINRTRSRRAKRWTMYRTNHPESTQQSDNGTVVGFFVFALTSAHVCMCQKGMSLCNVYNKKLKQTPIPVEYLLSTPSPKDNNLYVFIRTSIKTPSATEDFLYVVLGFIAWFKESTLDSQRLTLSPPNGVFKKRKRKN